jgi:hypothetical protein
LGLLQPAVVLTDNEYFENIRDGNKDIKEEKPLDLDDKIISLDKIESKVGLYLYISYACINICKSFYVSIYIHIYL